MKLLHLDHEGVKKLIEDMEEECAAIKKNALSMSWYMRGGVTYEDVLNMSTMEREEIKKIIDGNLEVTKKSQLPFF
jgi:imidazolonepropionase-like amidohydrolase